MTTQSITNFVSPQTLLTLAVPIIMATGGYYIKAQLTDLIKTAMQEVTAEQQKQMKDIASDQLALLSNQLEILNELRK